ncbi:hypothetical protein D3C75_1058410 [compost metagenome]
MSQGITLEGSWSGLTIWQKRKAKSSETVIVILVAVINRAFDSTSLFVVINKGGIAWGGALKSVKLAPNLSSYHSE